MFRGNGASPETLSRADSLNEERDDGRSGVVGRDVRVRDVERARLVLESRFELGIVDGECGRLLTAADMYSGEQVQLALVGNIRYPQAIPRVGLFTWQR